MVKLHFLFRIITVNRTIISGKFDEW